MAEKHRIPHIMKPHISNRMPSSFCFFDTETKTKATPELVDVSRQVLNFGYAYAYRMEGGKKTRELWQRFTTTKHFFTFLKGRCDKNRPLYVFAHNLGFDLTIVDFWHWTEQVNFHVDYFVLQDPPTFIIGRLDGMKVVFIDTLNYWRTSLAAIGESIGLQKLERPTPQSSVTYWDNYARRDVEVLSLAVEKLIQYMEENDLGQFGLSAASMALSTYKHRFMKKDIFIHDNRQALELERKSYYGGFTNCFFVGKLPRIKVYKLDINSMYPFVMKRQLPHKMIGVFRQPTLAEIKRRLIGQGVVAHVAINSKANTYPTYVNNRLCYCTGQYDTYLCGPELKRAIYSGDVGRVHSMAAYDLAFLFIDYIDFFWKERQRFKALGNDVNQYFVKLFMNMLYGKFGQLGYDTAVLTPDSLARVYAAKGLVMPADYSDPTKLFNKLIPECDWTPMGLGRPLTVRRINNSIQIKIPNGEHNESFPAIAGYITSHARELLLDYIRKAGPRNTYYCDTDSLFVNEKGYKNLERAEVLSQTELGKLKLEGTSNGAEFYAPKDYAFGGECVRKGIRRDATQISPTEFRQIQFEGIKSVLRRDFEPYIDVKTITKRNSRTYSKGIVDADGWVKPYHLPLPDTLLTLFDLD